MAEFNITTVGTPPRDVEIFGPTTVRIDRRRTDEIAGVPVLYLSAYVADDASFAEKVVAALAWVTDGTVSAARAGDVPNKPSPEAAAVVANDPAPSLYTMPEFVEDVDYSERLALADPLTLEAWKGWAGAMTRRVELAQDSLQLAALIAANDYGMKFCPPQLLTTVRKALSDAYTVTYNQAAAA